MPLLVVNKFLAWLRSYNFHHQGNIFFLEPTVTQYHFYDACYVENTRFSAKFFKAVFIFCCQQHGYFNTFTKALLK